MRCSPRATTRRSTTASRCAGRSPRRSAGRPGWSRSGTGGRRRRSPHRRRPGTISEQDVLADYAAYLLAPGAGARPARSEVVVDAGNGMAGLTAPAVLGQLDVERGGALLRARRHLPEPRGQPDRAGEPGRPAGQGARDRRRHRAGLRRRRRPLLPGRRARRAGQPERADRADRRPGAGPGPRRDDHPQPDHLARRTRDRARARRQAGADPGRALLHQGADGRDRSRVRRRALRALLLPGLLARRLRDAGGAARPGCAGRDRPAALGAAAPVLPPRRQRRDQLRGRTTSRPSSTSSSRPGRGRDGVEVDHLDGLTRQPRRLVVQCSRVQHRAPAAAERRGHGRSHHGAGPRRRPRRDQKEHR